MDALNTANLSAIGQRVAIPTYDRRSLTPGIVHFGVGGFHRAHQAMLLDRLMNDGKAFEWAICGVGVLPADKRMKQVMDTQDGLYTLVAKHADGKLEPRVIGSIIDYLYAPDDPESVIETMAALSTRIVSLTVTEGGYNFDHVTGEFNFDEPAVAHDLAADSTPKTTFGLITEALRRRLERDLPPFTVQSCDNIQGNGETARAMFKAFAERKAPQVAAWMETDVCFPNAMVDRITPVTTDADINQIRAQFAIDDAWPVVCEPFIQWVIEDNFNQGRPPYEDVGAQIVEDVEPYELMKLRLLNASHQALCYFGYLAGYRYAHEVAQDQLFADFILQYMVYEATPTLAPVPGIDLDNYRQSLIERFANPAIKDTLARLCAESSDRIPKWLLPVIREQLANDGPMESTAAVVASWARYAEGIDEAGAPIEIVDRIADELRALAANNRTQPTAFIANRKLFGDLVDNERFVSAYLWALGNLHQNGARATVSALTQQ